MDESGFDAMVRSLGSGATRRGVLGALAGVAGLLGSESVAKRGHRGNGKRRGKAARRVSAAAAKSQGQGRYQTLAAKWWAWAIAEEFNPIIATGSVDCTAGQQGNTWFLAGSFFDIGPVARTCTVPTGTKLFFPVVNAFAAGPPAYDSADPPARTQKQLAERRASAAAFIDAFDPAVLTATIKLLDPPATADETAVPIVRAQSALFPIHLGDPNVFGAPAGNYLEAADGYWVLLDPLAPGTHEIHFAANPVLDVTYQITVA